MAANWRGCDVAFATNGPPTERMRKTAVDHRGVCVRVHDPVRLRLVAGEGMTPVNYQLLDLLGTERLVLDQHDR